MSKRIKQLIGKYASQLRGFMGKFAKKATSVAIDVANDATIAMKAVALLATPPTRYYRVPATTYYPTLIPYPSPRQS